jgi:SLT domain-containing protein
MIQRLMAQALAARLTTALFGDLASTGQLGGLIGGALSFGGARANGGPVTAGRAYLVGERGPELIVPRSSGMVVPNDAMGGVQVHQHINVAAGVTRGELVAAVQLSAQQTRAELMAELRARRVL